MWQILKFEFFFGVVNYIGGLYLGDGSVNNAFRAGIVMEFVPSTLRSSIEKDERLKDIHTKFRIAKQIASGMNFLHSLNPFILVTFFIVCFLR